MKALSVRISCAALLIALSPFIARADGPAKPAADVQPKNRTLGIVLYRDFELLDVCGPAEMFGNVGKRLRIVTVAARTGPIASRQGPKLLADYDFENCPPLDLIMVPGGMGTFAQLNNSELLEWLKARAPRAEIVTSVCSGASILAKARLLDGRPATTNKQHYRLCTSAGPKVKWQKEARWVDDGNVVTSSGVSAGMDMAIHLIARLYGPELAQKIADGTEYQWHRDAHVDPFAKFAK